jgi:ADP-heptose:LPS heptosyltransferase
MKNRKIILKNFQSPGDILMLTAAVRDLKLSHPDLLIDVRTSAYDIWKNNPHITKLDEKDTEVEIINAEYPLIHSSNDGPWHFIHGFIFDIGKKLNLKINITKFKGDIHLSNEERSWISQIEEMGIKNDFWILMAGGKNDFTAKWQNPKTYQEVINHFKDKITFVQCGEKNHWHLPLENTINLIGKTDLRQFIRLIHHSIGVLCPITFAMHAAVAVPVKNGRNFQNRPCVVVAGGREPAQWEAYPHHRFLSLNGSLLCCDNGGCWKSRCQLIGDGDIKDTQDLCIDPVQITPELRIPKCMDMIKSQDIIRAIETYYEGGVLKWM